MCVTDNNHDERDSRVERERETSGPTWTEVIVILNIALIFGVVISLLL